MSSFEHSIFVFERKYNSRNWNNPRDMDFRERADRNPPFSGYGNDASRRGQWSDQVKFVKFKIVKVHIFILKTM